MSKTKQAQSEMLSILTGKELDGSPQTAIDEPTLVDYAMIDIFSALNTLNSEIIPQTYIEDLKGFSDEISKIIEKTRRPF